MELLTRDEQRKLNKLLLTLPNIDNPATRRLLIGDLPRKLQDSIAFSDVPAIHINTIIDLTISEAWMQLRDGSLTVRLVIDNAIQIVEGSWLAGALEELSNTLKERHLQQLTSGSELPVTIKNNTEQSAQQSENLRPQSNLSIPDHVRLLDLLEMGNPATADLWSRWNNYNPADYLRIPIGRSTDSAPLYLSLSSDAMDGGPHGLIGGMSGSGKSELLRSIIMALAATYHPERLNFILIDGEGVSFADLEVLPHIVGLITDFNKRTLERGLLALQGELRNRQRLLAAAGVENVSSYQTLLTQESGRGLPPLADLLLIIDEFAELTEIAPEFLRGLTNIGRIGRSLGIHLLLSTQRPIRAITTPVRAIAGYKICLRVADPQDSSEIIGSPDAALLPTTPPGRGLIQVASRLIEFQAAQITLYSNQLNQNDELAAVKRGEMDIKMLVDRIVEEASTHSINPLLAPWRPELPPSLELGDIIPGLAAKVPTQWPDQPPDGWLTAVIGLLDDPAHQWQGPYKLRLGGRGHVAVFGAARTGKTTTLRTAALALALSHSPDNLHLYGLDFGRGALTPLAHLPHCGDVLYPTDIEKILRLITELHRKLTARIVELRRVGLSTLIEYRNNRESPRSFPYIVVLLDNFTTFSETFLGEYAVLSPEQSDKLRAQLTTLLREGPAVGIHFLLTVDSWHILARYPAWANAVEMRLALRQTDPDDYAYVGLRTHEDLYMPSGRGFTNSDPPLEFQIALPSLRQRAPATAKLDQHRMDYGRWQRDKMHGEVGGPKPTFEQADVLVEGLSSVEQTAQLEDLCRQLHTAWSGPRVPPVRQLPDLVLLDHILAELPVGGPDAPLVALPLGRLDDTLAPFRLELSPHHATLLVAGPPRAGKSTLLVSAVLSLARCYAATEARYAVVAFRRSPLWQIPVLPHLFSSVVKNGASLVTLRKQLEIELDARQLSAERGDPLPPLLLVFDDIEEILLRAEDTLRDLTETARRGRSLGLTVLAAGLTQDLNQSYDNFVRYLRQGQTGFLLCPSLRDDGNLLETRLPALSHRSFPPGRGFFVNSRVATLLQIAVPLRDSLDLPGSLERWVQEITATS